MRELRTESVADLDFGPSPLSRLPDLFGGRRQKPKKIPALYVYEFDVEQSIAWWRSEQFRERWPLVIARRAGAAGCGRYWIVGISGRVLVAGAADRSVKENSDWDKGRWNTKAS